jgi:hypothetical protein
MYIAASCYDAWCAYAHVTLIVYTNTAPYMHACMRAAYAYGSTLQYLHLLVL